MANILITVNWTPHSLIDGSKQDKLDSIYKALCKDESVISNSPRWRELLNEVLTIDDT